MKISEKIKENKLFFIIFGLMTISSVIYLSELELISLVDPFYPPLYVINYDCGFSSRLLVGAVFSLFFKESLDIVVLTRILLAIYFIMCFCISLFINNYLKNTEYTQGIGIYISLIVLSPVFLAFLKYLGTTDMFWIFLVLASLAVVNKKYLRWFVPVFCVISLAIHEIFAVTYLPLIAIAVLYQFIKQPKLNNFVFIASCALIVGAAAVYFIFIGDGTMKMTSDTMVEFASNRLDMHKGSISDYYLRSIFFWETDGVEAYSGLSGFLQYNYNTFIQSDNGSFSRILTRIVSDIITAVPFFYLIVKSARLEKNIGKKFIFICSAIAAVPSLAILFFSTDTERYSLHFILNIIFLILFFIKEKDFTFNESYKNFVEKVKTKKFLIPVLAVLAIKIILR